MLPFRAQVSERISSLKSKFRYKECTGRKGFKKLQAYWMMPQQDWGRYQRKSKSTKSEHSCYNSIISCISWFSTRREQVWEWAVRHTICHWETHPLLASESPLQRLWVSSSVNQLHSNGQLSCLVNSIIQSKLGLIYHIEHWVRWGGECWLI